MTNEKALKEIYRLVTRQLAETPRGKAGDTGALVEIAAICELRPRSDYRSRRRSPSGGKMTEVERLLAENADMRKRLTAIHDLAAGLLAEPLVKIDESVLVRICDLVQCDKFPEVKP